MIELYSTDNPAAASYFTYDYERLLPGKKDLERWRNEIKGAAFYFIEQEDESREFKTFFRQSVESLLENNRLFFVYMEPVASTKSRLRTYRKLFRPRQKELGPENLFEVEVPVNSTESVLVSSIRITEENIDFVFQYLTGSMLAFIYLDKPSDRPPLPEQSDFLEQLVTTYSCGGDASYRINLPLLALRAAEAEALIFRLQRDGQDRQSIEWYGRPEHIDEIIEQLGRLFRWRKREVMR